MAIEANSAAAFRDRRDAGRRLAEQLSAYRNRSDVTVLALPRGGVPVGYEVARALDAPLDVFVVRKLGVPGYDEVAMAPMANSSCPGMPSLRTTNTSSGTPSASAIS